MIRIVLVNDPTSGVTDAELEVIGKACKIQLQLDLLDLYGPELSLHERCSGLRIACAHQVEPLADDWRVEIDPHAAYARGAGYHEVRDGVPVAKVNPANPTRRPARDRISRIISHECIELVCNPMLDAAVESLMGIVEWEPCDPVQHDTYRIGGVVVSNFVGPRWYSPSLAPKSRPSLQPQFGMTPRYDRMALCTQPCELRMGYVYRLVDGRWYRDSAEMEQPELIE